MKRSYSLREHISRFSEDSEVGKLIKDFDWSTSSLGDPSNWSTSLQTMVQLVLHSKSPKFLGWGPECALLYNDAYVEILGDRHPSSIGKPLREVWAEIWSNVSSLVTDTFNGRASYFEDAPFSIYRNGRKEMAWFSFEYTPVFGLDGKVEGLYCALHETTLEVLTEQRNDKHESELRNAVRHADIQEQRFNALLQASPVGIGFANASGKLIISSEENRRLWGQHPLSNNVDEYVEWKGWWADGSEKHGRRVEPQDWGLARALRGEEVTGDVIEIEPFGYPGTRKTILLKASPVCDAEGRIVNAVVAQIDITERVKVTQALRESEAKFRTITNAMTHMVWATQPGASTDYFNDRTVEFTGLPVQRLTGDGWGLLIHPDDLPVAYKEWQDALAMGTPFQSEYRLRHHSGEYRWILGRGLPIRSDDGTVKHWIGTFTDIHDQKTVAEQLYIANKRKDEFLAILAHELRTPLAAIANGISLLPYRFKDETRLRNTLSIIERQVHHMKEITNDLLDVSRIAQGLVELQKRLVDIKTVILNSIEQVRPFIEAKRHILETLITAEHATVLADQTRMIQAVSNILTNAAKYTQNGGQINVELTVDFSWVKILVKDNGNGIDPVLLPRIFDLFTQGERTSDRAHGGLGLGLTLVKQIIELHGGHVVAQSEGRDKGSTFILFLPRVLG